MQLRSNEHTLLFCVSCTLGTALLWNTLRGQIYTAVFARTVVETGAGQANYYVALVVMFAACVIAVIFRGRLEADLLARPRFLVALGALGTVATLVMYLVGGDVGPLRPIYLLAETLLGASTVVILLSWGALIAATDDTTSVVCCVLGCALSFFSHLMPVAAYDTIVIVGSICSCCFRCACDVPARTGVDVSFQSLRHLPTGLIVVLMLFLLFGSVMRGILYAGSVRHATEFGSLEDVISIVFSLLLFAIVLISKWNRRTSLIIWLVLSVLFFAGLFTVALLGPHREGIEIAIIIPARTLIAFYLWLVIVIATGDGKTSTVLALSVFYLGIELLSAVVTYVIMPFFAPQLSNLFDDYATVIALVVTFTLTIGSLLFLTSASLRRGAAWEGAPDTTLDTGRIFSRETSGTGASDAGAEGAAPGGGRDVSILDVCRELAPAYGLTPRETEIMALIAQGHSVKKMAEILVVSPTTIQSHSRSLYNKLDVHDRQSIIDLVDARKALL